MKLSDARCQFTQCMAELILHARHLGYSVLVDQVRRSRQDAAWNATHCAVQVGGKRCEQLDISHDSSHEFRPIGLRHSVHLFGLAVDLYIIENGQISNDASKYEALASFWLKLNPLARWGGDFKNKDLGHFSFEWNGRR